MKFLLVLATCFASFFVNEALSQQKIYVDQSATGLNNGSSWENAYKSLDSAFNRGADIGANDSIFVAEGIYFANNLPRGGSGQSDSRNFAFRFPDRGVVMGGFKVGGSERNPFLFKTTLQGHYAQYHVALFVESSCIADGFEIKGGGDPDFGGLPPITVSGHSILFDRGAGVVMVNSTSTLSKFIITNNEATKEGGGVHTTNSILTLRDCFFYKNKSSDFGGAIANNINSSVTAVNCVFSENWSIIGGAIYNKQSTSRFYHCTFAANIGSLTGGGIYNDNVNLCEISNTVFSMNNFDYAPNAEEAGTDIMNYPWLDTVHTKIRYSNMQFYRGLTGTVYSHGNTLKNINDPDGPDNIWGTADDGLIIRADCAGFNTGANGIASTDITNSPRNLSGRYDMGAYEIDPCSDLNSRVVYVDGAATGNNTGNSWTNAVTSLQAAVNLARMGCVDTIKVAQGQYAPTNTIYGEVSNEYFASTMYKTFQLPSNVTLLGGYKKGGQERNTEQYPSVLKPTVFLNSTNCQIFTIINSDKVTIDGFTISTAVAKANNFTLNGMLHEAKSGGAISAVNSEIMVNNCKFVDNVSEIAGGSIFAKQSKLKLSNSHFFNNQIDFANSSSGGAIYLKSIQPGSEILNTTFDGNFAGLTGGAIALDNCDNEVRIDQCKFLKNSSLSTSGVFGGGAIYANGGSRFIVSRSNFYGDTSRRGSAIYLTGGSTSQIDSSVFNGNFSPDSASVIYSDNGSVVNIDRSLLQNNEGGIRIKNGVGKVLNTVFENNSGEKSSAVYQDNSNVTYVNNLFFKNRFTIIGGSCITNVGSGSALIANCTFANNYVSKGGAVSNNTVDASATISNSLFWNNTRLVADNELFNYDVFLTLSDPSKYSISHCIFPNIPTLIVPDTASIYGSNPTFVDTLNPIGLDSIWRTSDDGFALQYNSIGWNKGSNALVPLGISTDIKGKDRFANDSVDIGAYEYDCVEVQNFASTLVPFGTSDTAYSTLTGCGSLNYFESESQNSRFIAVVGDNGNDVNINSVMVDATNAVPHFAANGLDTVALANRMVTIIAPGTFNVNGGLIVRVYYDSTEFASLPILRRQWFKHPANSKAGVLADLTLGGLSNAEFITPSRFGTDNGITYVEFQNITSFSTFGLIASNINIALPVSLKRFDVVAVSNGSKAKLAWETDSEENNARFEVERSSNGLIWEYLGFVEGNGTTSVEHEYVFIDNSPIFPRSYYRLKQIDIDGRYKFSPVRWIEFETVANAFLLTPNPASNSAFIQFQKIQKMVRVQVFNINGQQLSEKLYQNIKQVEIKANHLPSGLYILRVNDIPVKLNIQR